MKKKIKTVVILGALLSVALTGCTSKGKAVSESAVSTNKAADAAAGKRIKVVLKTLSSEYWNYVAAGCRKAGEELGVKVDVLGPSSETAYDEQQSMIETILSSKEADALVIAPQQSDTVSTLISGADIPIVAVDTNVQSDKVRTFVGFDNKDMGKMGGIEAVKAAKEAGWKNLTAIGIAGVQGDATSEDRLAGYMAGIESEGGVCLKNETQYADGIADKAVTAMEGIMQTHPEGIAIIYCNNDDMAMGASRAAKGNPAYEKTIFLGCGGNQSALDSIENSEETMTVAVDGWDVGYKGVENALKAIQGQELPAFISSPASIVTKNNVDEQRAQVSKRTQ